MDLYSRARELDIQTEFIDGQGHRHVTEAAALKTILDALPEPVPSRLLAGSVVIRSGRPSQTAVKATAELPLQWKIMSGPRIVAQGEAQRRSIAWPADSRVYSLHRLLVLNALYRDV